MGPQVQGNGVSDIYADGIACGSSCPRATFLKAIAMAVCRWMEGPFKHRILPEPLGLEGAPTTLAWTVKNTFAMLNALGVPHSGFKVVSCVVLASLQPLIKIFRKDKDGALTAAEILREKLASTKDQWPRQKIISAL